MDAIKFLQDLTVVLSIAAAVLLLFHRLKQPPVLGYLAAGLIIGPHTPPFPLVTDIHTLETFAEIGVVFLMFALGVEFNLRRLARAGIRPLVCAGIEASLMMGVGYCVTGMLGWSAIERMLFGGTIAFAGTAIVARTLLERAKRASGWEELAAGTLIAEDILAIILIAFFSSVPHLGNANLSAAVPLLLRFAMFVIVILVAGLLILPRILQAAERTGMEEVRSLVIISSCFGFALLTQKLGYSAALGAFLAGAMASTGGPTAKLQETIAPFKDVFGAVFFVSVGMLINPRWLVENWVLTLGLTIMTILARVGINFLALAAVGESAASAMQATLARLPIGEFSFILAQLAHKQGITTQPIYPLAVAICLGTTIASSQLLPLASEERLGRLFPTWIKTPLESYRASLGNLSGSPRITQVWSLIRPSIIQMAVNLVGISGLFIAASAAQDRYEAARSVPGAVWIGCALVSLPFLIALLRKTQAVTLILLEAIMVSDQNSMPPSEARPILTRAVMGLSTSLLAWWYLSISFLLLPPWPYALIPLLLIGAAGFLLWRRMTRLYALIQGALRESLAKGDAEPETVTAALSIFVNASTPEKVRITPVKLDGGSWAVGRSLVEIGLRSKTGANLIQINRGHDQIPSPNPEVRLRADDELLLIGESEHIRKAKLLLESG